MTWTKDKPTAGNWRVSVSPKKRSDAFKYLFDGPVSRCSVFFIEGQLHVTLRDNPEFRVFYPLTSPWFDGAQWLRDEDPADPFAPLQPQNSRDSDFP